MAAKGVQRVRAGLTRHHDERVVEVEASCSCGSMMRIPVDRNVPVRDQLRDESCLFCGRLGQLTLVGDPRRSLVGAQ